MAKRVRKRKRPGPDTTPRIPTDLRADMGLCARYLSRWYLDNTAIQWTPDTAGTRQPDMLAYIRRFANENRTLDQRKRDRKEDIHRRLEEFRDGVFEDMDSDDVDSKRNAMYDLLDDMWMLCDEPYDLRQLIAEQRRLPPALQAPDYSTTGTYAALGHLVRVYGDRIGIEPAENLPWFNLVLTTNEIVIGRPGEEWRNRGRYYVGVLKIRLRFSRLGEGFDRCIRVDTTHKQYRYNPPNYYHPHVTGGGVVCMGDGKIQSWRALQALDLVTAIRTIERIIELPEQSGRHSTDGFYESLVEMCRRCDAKKGLKNGVCEKCGVTLSDGSRADPDDVVEIDGKRYHADQMRDCPISGKKIIPNSSNAIHLPSYGWVHKDAWGQCEFCLHSGIRGSLGGRWGPGNVVEVEGRLVAAAIIPWLVRKEKVNGQAWKEAAAEVERVYGKQY